MSFGEASRVSPQGGGKYTAEVQPGWDIFGVTNGGYLLGIAGRAIEAEAEGRTVASVSARYLNPAGPGNAEIVVEPLKTGRTMSTFQAILSMEGKIVLTAHASLVDQVDGPPAALLSRGAPPELPRVDDCMKLVPGEDAPLPPPFAGKVECYIHPDDYQIGTASEGGPRMRGWFRLTDDEPLDGWAVVLASDAFPPAIFNSDLPVGWTPTVDLTVHVRDPRPRGMLMCSYSTRFVSGGWLDEDGELWDTEGNLVALSRQLALVPR